MFSLQVCLLISIASSFAVPISEVNGIGYGIVGGQSAKITTYPFTAAIYSDPLDRLIGGGAILNKNWVVCSAYEIMGFVKKHISIRVGSSNAGYGGQYINLTKIVKHESFLMDYSYDIALLKTMTPIELGKEAKAVKLANSKPKSGSVAQITGFGKTLNPSDTVMNLKVADVQVISQTECEAHHGSIPTAFCAHSDGVGPCSSDLGNPLVYNKFLIGLYIGGDTCSYHGKPELYTDVTAFRQWIEDTIKKYSTKEQMEGMFDDDYGAYDDSRYGPVRNKRDIEKDVFAEDGYNGVDDDDDDYSEGSDKNHYNQNNDNADDINDDTGDYDDYDDDDDAINDDNADNDTDDNNYLDGDNDAS